MNKRQKLKACNRALLMLLIVTLASAIQLEATGSRNATFVWLHIIISTIFLSFVILHINLHFGWHRWLIKFSKLKSKITRILWWATVAIIISTIIALTHWLLSYAHSPVGAVHGKIGFLMLLLAAIHTVKRVHCIYR